MTNSTTPARRGLARARHALASAALAVLLLLGAAMLVPAAFGYRRYVVDGGSMGTTIPRGSLVYDELVPVRSLRVGDVITYASPAGRRMTHRIVAIRRGGVFATRGDANAARDPWTFTLRGPLQARVVFHVPLLGYAYAALAERPVRVVVLGVPALLVAISTLAGLRRPRDAEASA